ncbi:hypothetical protein RRG08_006292 [Elysia crispata]|uniref:Uncharacterized protein n=1 Tax=Elysia crispata TaxID=231223 RepID=A0AAE0YPT6_9GAST|nr:hypothetical protein RRG08_006292 [Elysia crispata]
MEVEAGRVMWGLSLERNFSVHDNHQRWGQQDPQQDSEECTNHLATRLGTGLRNLVSPESKKGNGLGGGEPGALTQQKIALLQGHYKKAVASKCAST